MPKLSRCIAILLSAALLLQPSVGIAKSPGEEAETAFHLLTLGTRDELVQTVHEQLADLGYLSSDAPDIFQQRTYLAKQTSSQSNRPIANIVQSQSETKSSVVFIPPTLTLGMSGQLVQTMQKRLVELNYLAPDKPGVFSQKTYLELRTFQQANHLTETGELDAQTAQILFSNDAISAPPVSEKVSTRLPRTASALIAFAYSKLGKGYIYGTSGQTCSPWLRAQNAKQYPDYDDVLTGLAKKWDGEQVFDCIGLIKAFMKRSEGEFPADWNTNVNGATKRWILEIGPIETMPREPGILLLQKEPEDKSYSHIGIYVGNGKCIHARGHAYGVVEDAMPQLWTHWARPVWLTYDLPVEEYTAWDPYLAPGDVAMVDTSFGGDLPLWDAPSYETGHRLGYRAKNKTLITIDALPEDETATFWRKVTIFTKNGKPVTGYVYAKNLTVTPDILRAKNALKDTDDK